MKVGGAMEMEGMPLASHLAYQAKDMGCLMLDGKDFSIKRIPHAYSGGLYTDHTLDGKILTISDVDIYWIIRTDYLSSTCQINRYVAYRRFVNVFHIFGIQTPTQKSIRIKPSGIGTDCVLPMTESVQMFTMPLTDNLGLVDLRSPDAGLSAKIQSLEDSEQGYFAAGKAACRAYVWSRPDNLTCIDRGTMHKSSIPSIGASYATDIRRKIISPNHLLPTLPWETRSWFPYRTVAGLSEVSPIVTLTTTSSHLTKIFDVKRQALVGFVSGEHWKSTKPLFVRGIPEFVGINSDTNLLEIVV
jgi:hypothetical protein